MELGRYKLPVGIENFSVIRKEGFYYVDKTGLLRELLNALYAVTLFTRPRRFEKCVPLKFSKWGMLFYKEKHYSCAILERRCKKMNQLMRGKFISQKRKEKKFDAGATRGAA